MSWSRASLLSMEKSGSSGASGRWGKAMAAVTWATGWKKGDALRSEVAGSGPGKCRMALLQVRAQNPKETPQGALARQPHWRNEWPATSRPDSCSQRDLASGQQPLYPAPPLRSTSPVRRILVYTCRDTKERGGFLDLPEVPHSRAPLRVPGKGRRPGRDIWKRAVTRQRSSFFPDQRRVFLW